MRLDVLAYDELPYTSSPMPYAQPQHLATLGTLFGMNPPPVATSRVLELGCNDGKNIIATAYSLPQAECWGVDMSAEHIAAAQQVVDGIGLQNVTLKQLNILQLNDSIGKFDYIIAHGIYSWVSRAEQDKILQLCKNLLTASGIAYVSYSTRPGWDKRTAIRDMLTYYTSIFDSAEHRVEYMQQLLTSLHQATADGHDAYTQLLQQELQELSNLPRPDLFYESLHASHEPLYFHQFIARAKTYELDYLGDAFFHTMLPSNLPPATARAVYAFPDNVLQQEQMMDFLRNRAMRHTLLCHAGTPTLNRSPSVDWVSQFCYTSSLNFTGVEGKNHIFENRKAKLVSENPIIQATFHALHEYYPQAMSFAALVERAAVLLQKSLNDDEKHTMSNALLRCYSQGIIEWHISPPALVIQVSDFPKASQLARWEIQYSNQITNLRCEWVTVEDIIGIRLLPHLDGSRNRSALLEIFKQWIANGELDLNITRQQSDEKIELPEEVKLAVLTKMLEEALLRLAKLGILEN